MPGVWHRQSKQTHNLMFLTAFKLAFVGDLVPRDKLSRDYLPLNQLHEINSHEVNLHEILYQTMPPVFHTNLRGTVNKMPQKSSSTNVY